MPDDGGLHQISTAIGRLQAQAEASEAGRKALHTKVDDLHRSVSELTIAVRESNARSANLQSSIDEIKPEVEVWRGLRNRALGGLAVAGLLLSAGGAAVAEAVSRFLERH